MVRLQVLESLKDKKEKLKLLVALRLGEKLTLKEFFQYI